jgi:hypothetical protein
VTTAAQPLPAWRWLPRLGLFGAIAAVTLWVHLYEFNGMTQWDSAAFLAIGKLLQRGLMLYRDLWDTKPPGIYIYQTVVFSILPVQVWSLRLTDYILYVAAGMLFYRLCALEARWLLALAATAIWLYLAHHPSFNIAGFYTEEYSSICAIAAVAAAVRYWRRGELAWVVASGVLAATAVIFKHPGAACGLPIVVLISGRRPLRAVPLFVLSGAAPIALVVGYFWWRGALDAFVDCQFLHLLEQHGITAPSALLWDARLRELGQRTYAQLTPYPAVLWPALFGSAVCLLRPNRFRLAVLLWLVADLLFIAAQKFYYEHYYIQLFASAVLVGVIGAAWLLQGRPGEGWMVAVPRLAACAVVVALAWNGLRTIVAQRRPIVETAWAALRSGPDAWPHAPGGSFDAELGEYMKERTSPDERIFIYETGTRLAAYWTADRLPASRYIFSIVPQSSFTRQAEQIAELERTRPAYVAIAGNPVFRYFTPFLLANYTLATVKWGGDRVEIWARNEPAPFAAGTLSGLIGDARRGGLVLPAAPAAVAAPLVEAPDAQRGTWTSPVLEVAGGGGELAIDWSPRADLAANPTGVGYPAAEASLTRAFNEPRAVLGAPTQSGQWSTTGRPEPETLTIRLGFPAVADRIVLQSLLTPPDTAEARFQVLAAAGDDFVPVPGTWEAAADGIATYRFAAQPLSALRIVATAAPARPVGLKRVHVPAVGMGVVVRYRTGPTPDLAAAPWVAVDDEEGPRVVTAQRYVQIQCDVWSRYSGRSPVLRAVQIGRLRFQLDAPMPAAAPLRTAQRAVHRRARRLSEVSQRIERIKRIPDPNPRNPLNPLLVSFGIGLAGIGSHW